MEVRQYAVLLLVMTASCGCAQTLGTERLPTETAPSSLQYEEVSSLSVGIRPALYALRREVRANGSQSPLPDQPNPILPTVSEQDQLTTTVLSKRLKYQVVTELMGQPPYDQPADFPNPDFSLTPLQSSVEDPYQRGTGEYALLGYFWPQNVNFLGPITGNTGKAVFFLPGFWDDHTTFPSMLEIVTPVTPGTYLIEVTLEAKTPGMTLEVHVPNAGTTSHSLSSGMHQIPIILTANTVQSASILIFSPEFDHWEFRVANVTKIN